MHRGSTRLSAIARSGLTDGGKYWVGANGAWVKGKTR